MQAIKKNIIAICTFTLLLLFYFNYVIHIVPAVSEISSTDYPNYYFSGKRFLAGEEIYKPFNSELKEKFGIGDYKAYTADPPATVILLSPLSKLGIIEGAHLLNVISIILLCLSISMICKELKFGLRLQILAVAFSLSSFAFLFLLKRCHMESILLFLICLGFVSLKKGRYQKCGTLWGVAAALKLFPALLFIPYLFSKKKKDVFHFGIVAFSLITLVSFILIHRDDAYAFIYEVLPKSSLWYGVIGNYSLVSFFTVFTGMIIGIALTTVATILIILYLFNKYTSEQISDEALYAISISAALLISPLSWLNYLILVFPVILFLANKTFRGHSPTKASLLILAAIFWRWPDYINVDINIINALLSYLPTIGLLSILFYYQKFIFSSSTSDESK